MCLLNSYLNISTLKMLLFLGFLVKAIACTLRCSVGEPLKVFLIQIKNRIHKAFVSKHLMHTLSNNVARKTVSFFKKGSKTSSWF